MVGNSKWWPIFNESYSFSTDSFFIRSSAVFVLKMGKNMEEYFAFCHKMAPLARGVGQK
jgi:hypothetical protein